jgi:hypothetical protein
MLCHVTLVSTDGLEEHIASMMKVTRIDQLGATLAVLSNRTTLTVFLRNVVRLLVTAKVPHSLILVTLMMVTIRPSEKSSVLIRATQCNIPEDGSLHGYFAVPPITFPDRACKQNGTESLVLPCRRTARSPYSDIRVMNKTRSPVFTEQRH